MVERQVSTLKIRVRFSSPALRFCPAVELGPEQRARLIDGTAALRVHSSRIVQTI
jgi:hypothetical protein